MACNPKPSTVRYPNDPGHLASWPPQWKCWPLYPRTILLKPPRVTDGQLDPSFSFSTGFSHSTLSDTGHFWILELTWPLEAIALPKVFPKRKCYSLRCPPSCLRSVDAGHPLSSSPTLRFLSKSSLHTRHCTAAYQHSLQKDTAYYCKLSMHWNPYQQFVSIPSVQKSLSELLRLTSTCAENRFPSICAFDEGESETRRRGVCTAIELNK